MTGFARLLVLIVWLFPAYAAAQSRTVVTDDVDLFALELFDRIQTRSILENREYCGLIGFSSNDELIATGPHRGTEDSCNPGDEPAGFEPIASYHTHGAFLDDADSEVPSVDDLIADFEEDLDGYVATPGGRVWLNLLAENLTFQLCGRGCVVSDPKARPCKAFLPAIEYTLQQLRQRERTDPGVC